MKTFLEMQNAGRQNHVQRVQRIGLAGCEIGQKIEAGSGIRKIMRAGYGMKISWRDRDVLSSISGMRDSFKIDGGMLDLNSK